MQTFDHNIGFWEKRHFFAKNCQKSQKIVIITSTPGCLEYFATIGYIVGNLVTLQSLGIFSPLWFILLGKIWHPWPTPVGTRKRNFFSNQKSIMDKKSFAVANGP
jgi:hypothetical protein